MHAFAQQLVARFLTSLVADEEGQTMAEYGVVLALITLAVVLTLTALGLAIDGKLGDVLNILNRA